MAEIKCKVHGVQEGICVNKKDGSGVFWVCPVTKGKKDQNGNWLKCPPVEVANTPSGRFEQSLDKAATQMDAGKKDDTIARLAIAKEFIARGDKYTMETVAEMNKFLAWSQGRAMEVKTPVPPPAPSPTVSPEDEILVSDIPF